MSKAKLIAKLVEAGHEDLAEQMLTDGVEAAIKLSDQDLAKVAKMTQINNHTEARIYICENILKDKKLTAAYKGIQAIRDLFGNMPHALGKFEYDELYKRMLGAMKAKLSLEDYERLYSAL